MRRCAVSAALALGILAAPLPAQMHRVDAVNPSPEGEFPGGRGRDQLVVYTPAHGRPTTGTDELGSEALVVDGVVVELGGKDSPIPPSGFVVSGNGEAQRWIVRNLRPGTPVLLDETALGIDHRPAAQRAALAWRLAEMDRRLGVLGEAGDLRAEVHALAREVESVSDPLAALASREASLEAQVFARELAAMPSRPGEVHAVWHRLGTASPEAIAAEVQAMAEAHVNAVFTEVNFGSSVIYPDPTGLFPQIEEFEGQDPLAVFIEECHARGIEVHAWVHNFFLGGSGRSGHATRFAEAHPEWVSVNRRGESELVPWGYRYLNPTNRELHRALIAAHTAMMERYPFDGYHYDHIRYCLSMDWRSGWDYSDHTRARAREELGFDPMDITPDDHPEDWARWLRWREDQVSDYVRAQSEAVRAVRPRALITAAVFPDLAAAIDNKGQNWGRWVAEGWLDAAMPMAYTPDSGEVVRAVTELVAHAGESGSVVIGLGPYLGFTPRLLVEQITAARAAGATGECLFVWHRLSEEHQSALARGPWRSVGPPAWMRPSRQD